VIYQKSLINEYREKHEKEISIVVSTDISADDTISTINGTVEIPFIRENGVAKVKCAINDLPLHFVFDTGASDVTLSLIEANFMLKNDYIKPADIIGTARYIDANGDITEGTVVNLRRVNFGDLELDNVRASVVRNQKAPLLLGQSVLGRLGKIEIDNANLKLKITQGYPLQNK
jgi:clan AA aspartic protease (TIGR02281 family)